MKKEKAAKVYKHVILKFKREHIVQYEQLSRAAFDNECSLSEMIFSLINNYTNVSVSQNHSNTILNNEEVKQTLHVIDDDVPTQFDDDDFEQYKRSFDDKESAEETFFAFSPELRKEFRLKFGDKANPANW